MPLKNRVNPLGEIIVTPERGLLMGNRGCLHDAHKHIIRPWVRTAWVTCKLQFKDRHRQVMSDGQYTELFFLDEVTALAAGHRPCASCRREDFNQFKNLWLTVNPELAAISGTSMPKIDKELHSERLDSKHQKYFWLENITELPDGTMIEDENLIKLIWKDHLHIWTSGGYTGCQELPSDIQVKVITPPSVVNVLKAGYQPLVHPSVQS